MAVEARYRITAQDNASRTLRNVRSAALGVGRAMAGLAVGGVALAGAGFAAMVASASQSIDRIAKLSQATGLTTEFLSEMAHVAALSGVSLETVAKATVRLQRATAQALDGEKTYADAFRQLGIDVQRFARLSPDEQFAALAEATKNASDQTTLMAAGSDIAGRSFAELIPLLQGGAEGMAQARAEAAALGLTLTRDQAAAVEAANDAMTSLTAAFKGLAQATAVDVAPQVGFVAALLRNTLTPAVRAAIAGIRQFASGLSLALQGYRDLFSLDIESAIQNFRAAFEEYGKVGEVITGTFRRARTEVEKTAAVARTAGQNIKDALTEPVIAGARTQKQTLGQLLAFVRRFVLPDLRAAAGGGEFRRGTASAVSRSRFAFNDATTREQKTTNQRLRQIEELLRSIEINTARQQLGPVLA